MDKKEIAKRIREIREQRGMSKTDLAKLMGWQSHSSIVSIENGTQEVKVSELLKLAKILKVPVEAFYSNTPLPEVKEMAVLWRQKPKDPDIARKEEQILAQDYQNYRLVERLSETSLSTTKLLPKIALALELVDYAWANRQAEVIARDLQLGDYPATSLKKRLEEDYGILFITRPLQEGSAACFREENGAVILLNENEVRWRQTFDIAHELFHLITLNSQVIQKIQSQDLFEKNEKLANAFAAALLMPHQMIDLDVREQKITYSLIVALAGKYQVSKQAMLIRLRYLNFISQEAVDQALQDQDFLKLDLAPSSKAPQSSDGTRTPLGNRFIRMAYLAYEKGRLTRARLAQMLHVKFPDLDQYLAEKGLCLTNDKEIEGLAR